MEQLVHRTRAKAAVPRPAHCSCSRRMSSRSSSSTTTSRHLHRSRSVHTAQAVQTSSAASTATAPSRDVTADLLQAVMTLALKKRLTSYHKVDAFASCDARGLLEGTFDGMRISGQHWETPLGMTAHKLEVAIGVMRVDLSTLLLERRVALANVPAGSVSIQLSGRDMGAFLRHPLFQQTAATAVQNQAFVWDRDSVIIDHAQGTVWFTGTWAGNGRRYRMLMRPGGSSSQAGGNSSSAQRRPPLQVGAQLLADDGNPASDAAAHAKVTHAVAAGMANFFSSLALDLQGIEIRQPSLILTPGNVSERSEGDLLEIAMQLRLRALPPMDMQF